MLTLITKANDSYWYEFKKIKSIKDLFKLYPITIVETNDFQDWTEDELLTHWDGFKKEDIPLMNKAKVHVTIYNDYVE